ncbi:hypothetical protein DOTSEDRAFT_71105 [Dothistroma septosporum NZE10]|uniref:Uncharacterized protein n=1 Tax=Dothistroma septosporum (strain NZE10 / CBS 128990) TaxID=675120 RepID=N1PPH8_DOTSN|nr:hypothetical protein DOTSEDRAFT_71105 [Dothistroma septosporum NZE10]
MPTPGSTPHTDAATSSSAAERQALPTSWAVRTNSVAGSGRKDSTSDRTSANLVTSPTESVASSWRTGMPTPYETPGYMPSTSNGLVRPIQAPIKIPDSSRHGITPPGTTLGRSSEVDDYSPVEALPGTMSARRVQQPSNTRRRTPKDAPNACDLDETEQPTSKLGSRMKATLRGWFKKSSTDDSNFERIGDRHWSDE